MKQQYLEAGQIVSTHGVRGEVKVLPWADGPEFLCGFPQVYVGGRAYSVEQARVQKTCALLKLQGVGTVEEAQALRGQVIRVDREQAKLPSDRVFIADLLDLPVLADGREIGRIAQVLPLPGNDVYVVRGEHEYLIPAVSEFLLEVNIDRGFVRVKLLEGMRSDEN